MIGLSSFREFNPKSLPGVALWLDASIGISKDGSNNISQWNDLSGFNRHATQSSNNPTWVTNKINGRPAVSFNGTNQWFNLNCLHTDIINPSLQQITIFGVILTVSTSANQIFATATATAGYIAMYLPYSDGNCYWDSGNQTTARKSGAGNFNTNFGIVRLFRNNGIQTAHKNSVSVVTATNSSGTSSNTGVPMFLGAYGGTQDFTNGFIAEWIVYNRALAVTEIQQVERYLGVKYAISVP